MKPWIAVALLFLTLPGLAGEPRLPSGSDTRILSPDEAFQAGVQAFARREPKEAVRLFSLAADQEHADAEANLGYMYNHGLGVPMDLKEAAKWYLRGAGHGSCKAMIRMGELYSFGSGEAGLPRDASETMRWFRLAADQGDPEGQIQLGHCYFLGEVVPADPEEGFKYVHRAADQGNPSGQAVLADCLADGRGTPVDLREALKWYRKSAEQGYFLARLSLSRIYYLGEGVARDYQEALKWTMMAAEAGEDWAQVRIGDMYTGGQGVPKDLASAYMWYDVAAHMGFVARRNNEPKRDELAAKMTPEEMEKGKKLAGEWLAKHPGVSTDHHRIAEDAEWIGMVSKHK